MHKISLVVKNLFEEHAKRIGFVLICAKDQFKYVTLTIYALRFIGHQICKLLKWCWHLENPPKS